jgi:hypothetical protein
MVEAGSSEISAFIYKTRRCHMIEKSYVYSRGAELRSWPATEYTERIIVVFLSCVRQMPELYLKTCHDRFLSHSLEFTIIQTFYALEYHVQTALFNKILHPI